MKLLKNIINESYEKHLRVFDFDDTLVKTRSFVYVTKENGKRLKLSPSQYSVYSKEDGDTMDYSDFESVKDPTHIRHIMRIFIKHLRSNDGHRNVILTARGVGARKSILRFIRSLKIGNSVELITLNSSDPNDKKNWIETQIRTNPNIKYVIFYDDSHKNIESVDTLKSKYPNIKIETQLVK